MQDAPKLRANAVSTVRGVGRPQHLCTQAWPRRIILNLPLRGFLCPRAVNTKRSCV